MSMYGTARVLAFDKGIAEKMPAVGVFNANDPHVGIKLRLALQVTVGISLTHGAFTQALDPMPVAMHDVQTRGRWAVQGHITVESADLYEDGAAIALAAPYHHSGYSLAVATTDIGLHPEFGLDAHE
jgi:hypothetical protein